jgi:hypothetical protein
MSNPTHGKTIARSVVISNLHDGPFFVIRRYEQHKRQSPAGDWFVALNSAALKSRFAAAPRQFAFRQTVETARPMINRPLRTTGTHFVRGEVCSIFDGHDQLFEAA